MTTKLTLSIESKVIETAKQYAQGQGKSLSGLVENYLKHISANEPSPTPLHRKVQKLLGSIVLEDDFDYKKELSKSLLAKYK